MPANDTCRIGVYICHCGLNIASKVDVPALEKYAASLPKVALAKTYKFMCSDPGQQLIKDDLASHKLTHLVVASCSPLMHEPTFRAVLQEAGVNPYLYQMVNIREQVSWVTKDLDRATQKARLLITAAVRRVALHDALQRSTVAVNPNVLVVGAGIAGISAALTLASAGKQVYLVEREPSIGGHMAHFDKTFPTLDCAACILTPKMTQVGKHKNIHLMAYSEVEEVSGFIGNFTVKVRRKASYVDADKCTGCGTCWEQLPRAPHPRRAGDPQGQAGDRPDEARPREGRGAGGREPRMTVEAQAGMAHEARHTRPGPAGWDLSMHILDIAQNSVEAGATRIDIRVDEDPDADALRLVVTDNGRGMDAETAERATDPFFTTRRTRVVGLGLPLLRQAAEAAAAALRVASEPGEGTRVEAALPSSATWIRAPLGDVETTVLVLMASHPDVDLDWTHRRGPRRYSLATADLRAALDGASLASPAGLALVRSAVRHGEASLAQPGGRLFSNGGSAMTEVTKVDEIVDRHGRNRENLIAILLECQEVFLHLPREVIEAVSVRVKAPVAQVLSIATFYRGFSLKPVGRHRIHVCMGTACHVQGAPRLLDAVSRELGIQRGETTPDMEFSLDTVNCLGCCGLAPVVTVGTDVHGKLKQTGIPRMLRKYVKDYKAKTH